MGNILTIEQKHRKSYIYTLSEEVRRSILRQIVQKLNTIDMTAQERAEAYRNACNSRVCDLLDTINIVFV